MKFIKDLIKKWTGSRRIVLTVISGIIVIANKKLGLGLDTQDILTLSAIVIAFVLGESYKDAKSQAQNTLQEILKHKELLDLVFKKKSKK